MLSWSKVKGEGEQRHTGAGFELAYIIVKTGFWPQFQFHAFFFFIFFRIIIFNFFNESCFIKLSAF